MRNIEDIQWFPGHMAKTKRKIGESLKLVDIVAELVDARIPISSRNPVINSVVNNKPRLILLNKADMADPKETEKWVTHFKNQNITAIPIDCKSGRGLNKILPICKEVLKEQIEAWERKGMFGRPIKIMVVGVPNVGKSSLINKMCAGAKIGRAQVEDRPGVTRDNKWFTIKKGFELLDTPGVLWPKFEDPAVGQRLAFTGAVKDDVIDIESLACKLLEEVTSHYKDAVNSRYNTIIEDGLEGYKMLEAVGIKRGMLISGGEVDTLRAAINVLDEYRAAKLGRITLERIGEHT